MNTPSHLPDNLALLAHETGLLMRTAAGLDDESIRGASLCEGWTRAHVLSHIARNADGLGNLASWAVTGTPRAMYDSPEARDADIVADSTRGAQEIFTDLEDSAARFAAAATVTTAASDPDHPRKGMWPTSHRSSPPARAVDTMSSHELGRPACLHFASAPGAPPSRCGPAAKPSPR